MLSDGVVVVDAHARIVDANPEAQRMFGWEKTPVSQSVEIPMNNWINQAPLKTSMDQQQLKLNP
jgi:PAS domain-containing protein